MQRVKNADSNKPRWERRKWVKVLGAFSLVSFRLWSRDSKSKYFNISYAISVAFDANVVTALPVFCYEVLRLLTFDLLVTCIKSKIF